MSTGTPFIAVMAAALNTMLDGTAPLLSIGLTLLGIIVTIGIAMTGIRYMWGAGIDIEQLMRRAFAAAAVGALLAFWQVPIPGVGISVSHVLPAEGASLARVFGSTGLTESGQHLDDLLLRIEAPSVLSVLGGARDFWFYMLFSSLILMAKAAMIAVITYSMIGTAVCIAFGPLLVPLFLVPRLDAMAWGWVRVTTVMALTPAVAACWGLVSERLLWSAITAAPPGALNLLEYPGYYGTLVAVLVTSLVGSISVPFLAGLIFSQASHAGHNALTAVAAARIL